MRAGPVWILLLAATSRPLSGQGVSGAALEGHVTATGGQALESAIVELTDPSTGARWRTTTRTGGRWFLENLPVGGPYRATARAVGYSPAVTETIVLGLGQRLTLDFTLESVVVQLPAMTVSARPPPLRDASRSGPAQTIPDSLITRLPVAQRDFTLVALLSPQVVPSPKGGLSFAGQPDRLNSLQIDGATNNDLRGGSALPGSGTPGRDLGARTLSPEAIQELQVQSAPFDVRFGNFSGGLVNAVTRSGTNSFHGTLVGFYSGGSLVGKDAADGSGQEYDTGELGITLSGPIVRDRLAYFVDAGFQRLNLPQSVPLIGTDTTGGADSVGIGIRRSSLERFQSILSNTWGVDPGSGDAYPLTNHPANFFGKLSWQTGVNSRIEFSHNYSHADPDVLTFVPAFSCRDPVFRTFCLTSSAFRLPETTNATRLAWIASGATLSNELLLARLHSTAICTPAALDYVELAVDVDAGTLKAGMTTFCQGSIGDQNLFEVTDNVSVTVGTHRLTGGVHGELLHLPGTLTLAHQLGDTWHFASLDLLEAGIADRYTSTFRNPDRASEPMSDLHVHQLGGYLQDQWSPAPGLNLTLGLRVDVPRVPTGPQPNPALEAELGLDNTRTPSGQPIWSPRFGFNLAFGATGSSVIRGGAGVFEGRPAYKWFEAVYSHTGIEALTLQCEGADVPAFVLDPAQQPRSCGSGADTAVSYASVFDPGFRFPQSFKAAAGLDQQLPWGLRGTFDFVYTRAIQQVFVKEVNLVRGLPAASGEGGRAMYGTIDSDGGVSSRRPHPAFGSVLEMTNVSGDESVALSGQLQKRLENGSALSLSYTWMSSRDRFSAQEDGPDLDIRGVPVDGTLDDRNLAASVWNVPHKLMFVGAFVLPAGFHMTLTYMGLAGTGYTYVVEGDANADGFGDRSTFPPVFNDPIYVPGHAVPGGDISLVEPDGKGGYIPAPGPVYQSLEAFIESESCLATARGSLARRNACRNGWTNHTEARFSKAFVIGGGRTLEAIADVFNFLGVLHREWGAVHRAGGGRDVPLLRLVGYDTAGSRGVYEFLPVDREAVDEAASRWRVQLGLRVTW